MNTNEHFREITKEMADLCERKNKDYGASVNDTFSKYGEVAYLVRIEDKLNRARNLILNKKQEVQDEKIRDTIIDMANYCILMIIDMENKNENRN